MNKRREQFFGIICIHHPWIEHVVVFREVKIKMKKVKNVPLFVSK